jgi:hydroxyisourate hydrolase
VSELTTHVLDLVRGRPAAGVEIAVMRLDAGGREQLARMRTNADGRTDVPLLAGDALQPGRYELLFDVSAYFGAAADVPQSSPPFLGVVPVRVELSGERGRWHVPLLCTPWSYSTYLGS